MSDVDTARRPHQWLQLRPLAGQAAALVFAWPPVAATCCDGRMVAMLVNRDGHTHCVECDLKTSNSQHWDDR